MSITARRALAALSLTALARVPASLAAQSRVNRPASRGSGQTLRF